MSTVPHQCPSCTSPLKVSQLTCATCGTGVVGSFELSPFLKLSSESLGFLESFVRNRGNVKEMARETGESYWTIRRQLDEIIEELGFSADQPSQSDLARQRQDILRQLGEGEIGVEDAKKMLIELGD